MGLLRPLIALTKRLGRHRSVMFFVRTVVVPADQFVARLTRGRLVTFSLRELPTLLLTTTGRRSPG